MTLLLDQTPGEVAKRLTGRDYLSYSSISTFQACPLKWHFRYVESLPEETISASLLFGGGIHEAIEFHFRELTAGGPPPDLDMLLDVYQDKWRDQDLGVVQFAKGDDVNTLGHLAERVLRAFQASDLARPEGEVLGVEEQLRGPVAADCPDLLARVDLLIDRGDALQVIDWKTARSRWSQQQVDTAASQLLLYGELAGEVAAGKRLELQFQVITKTKTPSVDQHRVAVDQGKLARTKALVRHVWQAMQTGHIYPNPSPTQCPGCPFRTACQAWRG